MPLKSEKFLANDRSELAEASWPRSTVLPSLISAVVTSKLSLADSMKALLVSMIRPRSSPVPWKAVPASETIVRRSSLSTDSTVLDRLVSSVVVLSGVAVRSSAISEPSRRYGAVSIRGWSSTYCSPTAERLPTRAAVSAGMSSYSLSTSR